MKILVFVVVACSLFFSVVVSYLKYVILLVFYTFGYSSRYRNGYINVCIMHSHPFVSFRRTQNNMRLRINTRQDLKGT
jgi:hypothetical protein